MADSPGSLLEVLSRAEQFQVRHVAPFQGTCAGSLIHCTFEAHTIEIPPLNEVVLLAANAYRLKRALFDFGWGYRNHFSSHPHPLHLFPAGNAYRWNKDGWADVTLLTLDAASVAGLLQELDIDRGADCLWELSQGGFASPLIYHAVGNFLREASQNCPRLLVDSFCTLIVSELARQRPSRQPRTGSSRKLPYATLARVIDHVQGHLAADLSLDDLAGVAGLSKFHFLRCFKASTGASPLQYVTDLRLAQARRLLAGSQRPMTEIAAACGFAGTDQLARAFRRAEGVSPRSYRADTTGWRGVPRPSA
jgi:AraC family transcriptional regulator